MTPTMLSACVHQDPSGPFDYSLFGLQIRSELRLPELVEGKSSSPPQVIVRFG